MMKLSKMLLILVIFSANLLALEFKSKSDLIKFGEVINKRNSHDTKIDSFTKLAYIKFKNGTLKVKKVIYNKEALKKICQKLFRKECNAHQLNEFVFFGSRVLLFKDVSMFCKKLKNTGYFEVGGKIQEIIENKVSNTKSVLLVKTPKYCSFVNKKLNQLINDFKQFILENRQ